MSIPRQWKLYVFLLLVAIVAFMHFSTLNRVPMATAEEVACYNLSEIDKNSCLWQIAERKKAEAQKIADSALTKVRAYELEMRSLNTKNNSAREGNLE